MPARWRAESDVWHQDGEKLASPDNLATIRQILEDVGGIIVEHRIYRGATAPERMFFEDFDDFREFLMTRTAGGDSVFVWSFEDVCTVDACLARGKIPDLDGSVPRSGSY